MLHQNVRFTPESRHSQRSRRCPLSAKSGHVAQCAILTALRFCRHLVGPALIAALSYCPIGMLAYPFGDGDLPIHGASEGRDRTLLGTLAFGDTDGPSPKLLLPHGRSLRLRHFRQWIERLFDVAEVLARGLDFRVCRINPSSIRLDGRGSRALSIFAT